MSILDLRDVDGFPLSVLSDRGSLDLQEIQVFTFDSKTKCTPGQNRVRVRTLSIHYDISGPSDLLDFPSWFQLDSSPLDLSHLRNLRLVGHGCWDLDHILRHCSASLERLHLGRNGKVSGSNSFRFEDELPSQFGPPTTALYPNLVALRKLRTLMVQCFLYEGDGLYRTDLVTTAAVLNSLPSRDDPILAVTVRLNLRSTKENFRLIPFPDLILHLTSGMQRALRGARFIRLEIRMDTQKLKFDLGFSAVEAALDSHRELKTMRSLGLLKVTQVGMQKDTNGGESGILTMGPTTGRQSEKAVSIQHDIQDMTGRGPRYH
ncbi:hypothetical protein CVT26_009518 [Gymnopilus dilepis]|uniref:Uncharacterized protein n=1 Tax=Gymnopilus dilepis TaxID=231916 RepID=A0A409VJW3_9AGAR|nr:hypothetical protein CVT26_009518 [Gymnopilus dilepis]